jgi:hypothetical protein
MPYTEFCCRSGGSNLNAGSLDGSAEAATTPLVSYTNGGWNSGTGVFTPASGNPVSAGVAVGNFARIMVDGNTTATSGRIARVTAVTSTTVTLSTTAGSGTAPTTGATGLTLIVGGAWAGPSGSVGFPFGFVTSALMNSSSHPPRINLKNDQTYSITAAMTHNVAGPVTFQGYTTTFGDGGRATIDGGTSGASYVLLTVSGASTTLADVIAQNNGATGSAAGVSVTSSAVVLRVKVSAVRGTGLSMAPSSFGAAHAIVCEATGCNQSNTSLSGGFANAGGGGAVTFVRCVAHDNTGVSNVGFSMTSGTTLVGCVADTNGSHGFSPGAAGTAMVGCVAYGNAGSGVLVSAGSCTIQSCVLVGNSAYGVNVSSGSPVLLSNAFRSNTSGETVGNTQATGSVTLTADPFTDAANRDFSLNNTAGGGAACRGAGRGTFPPSDPTVGYPDIGAAQSQSSGSSNTGLLLGGLGQTGLGAF